jgi:hypothetical protein
VRVSLTGTTNNEYIKSMYLLNPWLLGAPSILE